MTSHGPRQAWGDGVATVTTDSSPRPGVVLDAWYPAPALGDPPGDDGEPPRALRALVDEDAVRGALEQLDLDEASLVHRGSSRL